MVKKKTKAARVFVFDFFFFNQYFVGLLIPKLFWLVFCSFLKFGQAILVGILKLNFGNLLY